MAATMAAALDFTSPVTWITIAAVAVVVAVSELVARAKGLKDPEVLGTRTSTGLTGLVIDLVGIFRLAAPDSWWAKRFYDEAKRRRAREHYADRADELLDPPGSQDDDPERRVRRADALVGGSTGHAPADPPTNARLP